MRMKRLLSTFIIVLAFVGVALAADETNSPGAFDYGSFRIIGERNIFNQNRAGRSRNYTRSRTDRTVRTDSFALRGTMSYEKGWFAFFDGSSSDYRKAVQPAEEVAGFKIASIGPDAVKLEAAGKQIELQVGMQMKRPEGGEWQVAGPNEVIERASSSAAGDSNSTAAASTDTPASTSRSGGQSDILKRLLEQREKEVNGDAPKPEPKKD